MSLRPDVSPSPEQGFEAPPIWEIAVSATTQRSAVNPYNVKGIHDLFRDELPGVERHPPVPQLAIGNILGLQPALSDVTQGFSPRWWFISKSGSDVLQLQENFVASNWRRPAGNQPGDPVDYPGYESLVGTAHGRIDKLRANNPEFPPPVACERMYDNLISLRSRNGDRLRVSDVLTRLRPTKPLDAIGFNMSWLERLGDVPANDQSILQIQINLVGLPRAGETDPAPFVKLAFNAGAVRNSWESAFDFFSLAHAHIRKRLMDLTTDKAHQSWIPK